MVWAALVEAVVAVAEDGLASAWAAPGRLVKSPMCVLGASGADGGQGFFLSNTSHSHPSTRHFPHGAWSFSEWPHVHIPSLLSLMPSPST